MAKNQYDQNKSGNDIFDLDDSWTCPCEDNPEYQVLNERLDNGEPAGNIEKSDDREGIGRRIPKNDRKKERRMEEDEESEYLFVTDF